MADKRQLKRTMKRLEHVKTWQLLVLFVLAAFISATLLRLNNVGMLQRRDAVLAADADGDQQAIQNRLYELQVYAQGHMNASTGDIYLTKQYARDSQAILQAASAAQNSGTPITAQAYEICRKSFSTWSLAAVQCVSDEVARLTPAGDNGTVHVSFPSPALYRHSFVAPVWSPDFAGFSVLLTLLIALVTAARMITWITLRVLLKRRYRPN